MGKLKSFQISGKLKDKLAEIGIGNAAEKQTLDDVKHYAEITYPEGQSTTWYEDQEVAERTQDQIEFHWGATSFKFYDKVFRKQNVNGQFVNAPAERRNDTPRTWIGKYFSLEQIAFLYGEKSAIYRDLKDNGYVGRVRTVKGYAYGVGPDEKVIDPSLVKFKTKNYAQVQDAERTM